MDKIKRFFELKEQWKKADDTLKKKIDNEIISLLDSLTDEEATRLATAADNDIRRIADEVAEIKETVSIREQLADILPFVSVSTISKRYFGKTSSWFYQRLNGNTVHGKPAKFSDAEIATLKHALSDIGNKISSTSTRI